MSDDWARRREDAARDQTGHSTDDLNFLDITGPNAPNTPVPLGHGDNMDSIMKSCETVPLPGADIYGSYDPKPGRDLRSNPKIGD